MGVLISTSFRCFGIHFLICEVQDRRVEPFFLQARNKDNLHKANAAGIAGIQGGQGGCDHAGKKDG
jgi:hypothetical protein